MGRIEFDVRRRWKVFDLFSTVLLSLNLLSKNTRKSKKREWKEKEEIKNRRANIKYNCVCVLEECVIRPPTERERNSSIENRK
jgi:hypothetical protein